MNKTTDQARFQRIEKSLRRRHAKDRRLKYAGLGAVVLAAGFLLTMMLAIISNGVTALLQAEMLLTISIPQAEIVAADGSIDSEKSRAFNWGGLVKRSLAAKFHEVDGLTQRRQLTALVSDNAGYELRLAVEKNPALIKQSQFWLKTSDEVDLYFKGRLDRTLPEDLRPIKDSQFAWLDVLDAQGEVRQVFNTGFFTQADSREAESAGILGAVVGSALVLIVTVILALPLAVMAAIHLEYFARPGVVTDLIEVNINNLAAVPSIVFGLLGLAVFLGFFDLPRSAPLVGGMVLALMTLPTIIIATRVSIRAVPHSIRDAALGLGASPMQAALDHVLPLALPGIMTGTIIGLAQALGETAPLIMIGMVAFIVDVPNSVIDPATALPVQIYIWSDSAERAFYERASLAIMVLLAFLITMNLLAVLLRQRFEKKWQ